MEATWFEMEQEVDQVVTGDPGNHQKTTKNLDQNNSTFVAISGAKNIGNGSIEPARQATVDRPKDLRDMAEIGMGSGAAIFVLLSIIIGALRMADAPSTPPSVERAQSSLQPGG